MIQLYLGEYWSVLYTTKSGDVTQCIGTDFPLLRYDHCQTVLSNSAYSGSQ
jgi:hypothetical protein